MAFEDEKPVERAHTREHRREVINVRGQAPDPYAFAEKTQEAVYRLLGMTPGVGGVRWVYRLEDAFARGSCPFFVTYDPIDDAFDIQRTDPATPGGTLRVRHNADDCVITVEPWNTGASVESRLLDLLEQLLAVTEPYVTVFTAQDRKQWRTISADTADLRERPGAAE